MLFSQWITVWGFSIFLNLVRVFLTGHKTKMTAETLQRPSTKNKKKAWTMSLNNFQSQICQLRLTFKTMAFLNATYAVTTKIKTLFGLLHSFVSFILFIFWKLPSLRGFGFGCDTLRPVTKAFEIVTWRSFIIPHILLLVLTGIFIDFLSLDLNFFRLFV